MNNNFQKQYETVNSGGAAFYEMPRGLFEVSGTEAVQFLNGLITNDVAKLEDGSEMLAAFPTLKGRMFAVVRVKRSGEKYLFETEEASRQKVYDNLFRFTFAGDFHLVDHSNDYQFFSIFGEFETVPTAEGVISFQDDFLVPQNSVEEFKKSLGNAIGISDDVYEVLRIESGIPKYGIDMDEETVVPEVDMDNMISYQKGCYIGQEVIARIHFRGKPAKQLRGLVFESEPSASADGLIGGELRSHDDKSAGIVTSVSFSPKLKKTIALGFVRNAFLEVGTELSLADLKVKVSPLPFE